MLDIEIILHEFEYMHLHYTYMFGVPIAVYLKLSLTLFRLIFVAVVVHGNVVTTIKKTNV